MPRHARSGSDRPPKPPPRGAGVECHRIAIDESGTRSPLPRVVRARDLRSVVQSSPGIRTDDPFDGGGGRRLWWADRSAHEAHRNRAMTNGIYAASGAALSLVALILGM